MRVGVEEVDCIAVAVVQGVGDEGRVRDVLVVCEEVAVPEAEELGSEEGHGVAVDVVEGRGVEMGEGEKDEVGESEEAVVCEGEEVAGDVDEEVVVGVGDGVVPVVPLGDAVPVVGIGDGVGDRVKDAFGAADVYGTSGTSTCRLVYMRMRAVAPMDGQEGRKWICWPRKKQSNRHTGGGKNWRRHNLVRQNLARAKFGTKS